MMDRGTPTGLQIRPRYAVKPGCNAAEVLRGAETETTNGDRSTHVLCQCCKLFALCDSVH